MICGQMNLENVAKACKRPMKQSKKSVIACEIMYAMLSKSLKCSWARLGTLLWGSANVHVTQTVLAAVGGQLNEVLATR
jgi:hypothetical protein